MGDESKDREQDRETPASDVVEQQKSLLWHAYVRQPFRKEENLKQGIAFYSFKIILTFILFFDISEY